MQEFARMQALLGICLLAAAGLTVSIWLERLEAVPAEERGKFLLYRPSGGIWLPAVFMACAGLYCLVQSSAGL